MKSNSSFTPLNSATPHPPLLPPHSKLLSQLFVFSSFPIKTHSGAGRWMGSNRRQVSPPRPGRCPPPPDRLCHLSTSGSHILSVRASFSVPGAALAPSGPCELKLIFFFFSFLLPQIPHPPSSPLKGGA